MVFCVNTVLFAQQDRIQLIQQQLVGLANSEVPGLKQPVTASVSGASAAEFIRGMAIANGINLSVDPALSQKISVNFSNESVLNILLFLVKQYNLDIRFTGSIMYVTAYEQPIQPVLVPDPAITYNGVKGTLSLDIRNDSLHRVIKKITQLSGINVISTPEVNSRLVSLFVRDLPFESAIDKLTIANELSWEKTSDGTYLIGKRNTPVSSGNNSNKPNGQVPVLNKNFFMEVNRGTGGDHRVTINAVNTPIADMIKVVAQELQVNHYIFSEPEGSTTINIVDRPFEEFLDHVLRGTAYTYDLDGGIYFIGKRVQEGFVINKVVPLQYRTTDVVIENIPSELKKDLELKAFPELNSLIVSGPELKVKQFEEFIFQIDKIVPVVMIEVLIIDINKSHNVSTGIEAGISDEPVSTSGTVFPGVDVTLSSSSINNILELISGTGVVNLGKVAPEFYIKLSALESQGHLKIRSTPRLSTLNGHEAVMSIGRTEYYIEETNNIIGSQNPQTVVTRTYKPVNADFSVTINPVVSGDDQVTLTISVEQSDFTTRISNNAPPGTSTRSFQSLIRVKSDEMIILGGLEETRVSDSGSGVPLLSRIPILKWFFSSRTKQKTKTKLAILIKPTVIY